LLGVLQSNLLTLDKVGLGAAWRKYVLRFAVEVSAGFVGHFDVNIGVFVSLFQLLLWFLCFFLG